VPINIPRLAQIYDRTAAFYDQVVADLQAKPKLEAIALLARQPREPFLEVGVGTAWAFARIVAASGPEGAVGIDLAAGMIEVARRRLRRETGITFAPLLLADARRLPFASAAFDCLLCTYTLEVLPDDALLPVLRECRRVLRPGGRIVLLNLTDGKGEDAPFTDNWQRRFAIDPERFGGARPMRAATPLVTAGFRSVSRLYLPGPWPSELLLALR
jgi:ubiquinone/menaquinone biosynthesis C-methylase UbiE